MPRKFNTRSQRMLTRRRNRTNTRLQTLDRQRTIIDSVVVQTAIEEAKNISETVTATAISTAGGVITIDNGELERLLEEEIQDIRSRIATLETP